MQTENSWCGSSLMWTSTRTDGFQNYLEHCIQGMSSNVGLGYTLCMGESLQDYSWIQDFEADFPQKVSLKMLNSAGNSSFSDLGQP